MQKFATIPGATVLISPFPIGAAHDLSARDKIVFCHSRTRANYQGGKGKIYKSIMYEQILLLKVDIDFKDVLGCDEKGCTQTASNPTCRSYDTENLN